MQINESYVLFQESDNKLQSLQDNEAVLVKKYESEKLNLQQVFF